MCILQIVITRKSYRSVSIENLNMKSYQLKKCHVQLSRYQLLRKGV